MSYDIVDMKSNRNPMRIDENEKQNTFEQRHLSSKQNIQNEDRINLPMKSNHRMNCIEYYEKVNVQLSNDQKTVDSPSIRSAKNKNRGVSKKVEVFEKRLCRDQKSKLVLIKFEEKTCQISQIKQ